jgi:hypothetical protein
LIKNAFHALLTISLTSISGYLFQSETGGHFDPFEDDMKGYNFNPQLSFTDRQIRFNIPPNTLNFDSIRIELAKD